MNTLPAITAGWLFIMRRPCSGKFTGQNDRLTRACAERSVRYGGKFAHRRGGWIHAIGAASLTHGFKAPKKPQHLIKVTRRRMIKTTVFLVVTTTVGSGAYLVNDLGTPKSADKMNPENVFRLLVCDPMPESVRDIRASGDFSFGGDSVRMECRIAPADFETVIQRGGFVRISNDSGENPFGALPASVPYAEIYKSHGGGAEGWRVAYLMAPASHDQFYISHSSS